MSSAGPRVEEQAASSAAARDCDAAHDLRDRICELAAAICELAARNPEADELARRCEAARATCEHAKTDVATACGE